MDTVSKEIRSRMMAAIKGKDTKPELAVRRALHARGFRFRLHAKNVPGRPDIMLRKHRAIVFVHGCFWHRHAGCRHATTPSSRQEYWQKKFEANVARDSAVRSALLEAGWRVATVWTCALRTPEHVESSTDRLAAWLLGRDAEINIEEAGSTSSAA